MVQVAVAYVVFNRPSHVKKTFDALRKARITKLYVIADGPRAEIATDIDRCAEVRTLVEQIDWPCLVYRNYSDINLGLKKRVSSGLDWVFSQEDAAIILEDDCLPHIDFFRYCETLLKRYSNDSRVAVVSGSNFQSAESRVSNDYSYYFSKYNHCWGWATWARAWQQYQGDIPFWPSWSRSSDWRQKTPNRIERRYWGKIFSEVYEGRVNSWAYPWTATVWYHGGLTATPVVNLVSNIGFDDQAVHTTDASSPLAGLPTFGIGTISHPSTIQANLLADAFVFNNVFGGNKNSLFSIFVYNTKTLLKSAWHRLKKINNK
jgi:hypothetical protein